MNKRMKVNILLLSSLGIVKIVGTDQLSKEEQNWDYPNIGDKRQKLKR